MDRAAALKAEIRRLSEALEDRRLPAREREFARGLHARLTSPVRITLMGPRGAPKTALLNALCGASLLPRDRPFPTLELSHRANAGLRVTRRDGSVADVPGHDLAALDGLSPSFVQVFAPLPGLQDITLLDLVTDGSEAQQIAAAKWAAPKTDIAIWVTPYLDDGQRMLWQRMPEAIRNHDFLVLLRSAEMPPPRELDWARELFRGVYPVNVSDAAELAEDRCLDDLRSELRRCVDLGRQADLAQAQMFLTRVAGRTGLAADAEAGGPSSGGGASDATAPTAGRHAANASAPSRRRAASETRPVTAPAGTPADARDRHRAALDLLRADAQKMLDDLEGPDGDAADSVASRCGRTVASLCDLIDPQDPLHDVALQAADYMVLLELEREGGADEEAAILLLQLKRAIEVGVAA